MNRLVRSPLASDPNKQQPIPQASIKFIQDSTQEALNNLGVSLIGLGYDASKVYILFGCIKTTGGGNDIFSAGAVFYAGEIYTVPAASFASGTDYGYILVSNPSPDPILLKDGTSTNVHNVRQVIISDTAATGASQTAIPNFSAWIISTKIRTIVANASVAPTGAGYTDIPSLTIITPNDGTTRNYLLLYKGVFGPSSASATSEALLRFYNVTDSVAYDTTSAGKASTSDDVNYVGINLLDFQAIGPNKIITVQGGQGSSTNPGTITASKFMLIEF